MVTGVDKIGQMVTHHILRAESAKALDVLAGKDHLELRPDHKAEAIEAGQQVKVFTAIELFASRRSLLEVV